MSNQEKISFLPAVLMTMNVMIGVGIYFNPQLMAAKAGNASFLGWGVVAIMLLPLIWVTALSARLFPNARGFYDYSSTTLNESVGFISIWSYLIGCISILASQVLALYDVIQTSVPSNVVTDHKLFFNIIFVLALAGLSVLSLTWITRIQTAATIIKLLPFFFVIGLLYFYWDPQFTLTDDLSLQSISSIIPFALFGYNGFEICTSISSSLEGGTKQVFRVILTAFFATATLYVLFHFGLLHIMGSANLTALGVQEAPAFLGLRTATMLATAKISLCILLVITYANAIYGNMITNVANYTDLARRKFIIAPELFTKLNTFNRPTYSVMAVAFAVFCIITFFPNVIVVASFANLGVVTTLIITTLSVLTIQCKERSYIQSIISCFSLAICAIFMHASWSSLGASNNERLVYFLAFIALLGAGLAMFKALRNKVK